MDNTTSNTPLKRIVAIHDISGLGKCSLTVALPVISAAGVECSCIPTALLSTHTGEFDGYTLKDLSSEMLPIARHWASEGITVDGIYTGYLASPEQAEIVEEIISLLRNENTIVMVDPVMADNGEYYHSFGDSMREAFLRLIRLADVITPNITEASLLTGKPYRDRGHSQRYISGMLDSLLTLGVSAAALTGVSPEAGEVGAAAKSRGTDMYCYSARPLREGLFYGTGDLFASALSALLVRGLRLSEAVDIATSLVGDSIDRSVLRGTPRRFGVDFESALPAYIRRVEQAING